VRQTYDILFVADPRFEGGTSSSMCVEIRAAIRHGFSCGLMMVRGPILRHPLQIHPEIRALLDEGVLERVDPRVETHARLVLIHHPSILGHFFDPKPDVIADKVLVILHHPVRDRTGRVQYDLNQVAGHGYAAFGQPVVLAPVSPVVRTSLPLSLPDDVTLLDTDWVNLIELSDWPARPPHDIGSIAVVGRHSRPDAKKWPNRIEDALAAYPDRPDLIIRILGGGAFLDELYPEKPARWDVLPFAHQGVAAFLQSLDFYVYYHSDEWLEAFGRTILEAICTGLVVILPPDFKALFGESAIYGQPADVAATIQHYRANPEAYAAQCAIARRYAEKHFGSEHIIGRLAAVGVELSTAQKPPIGATRAPLPTRNILFVSSNGIGAGHLTRQLAIASRLPQGLRPTFFTMSYAKRIATEAGYFAEYFPHHGATSADVADWNTDLAEALLELMAHLRPSVLVYDATAVFHGVLQALATYRDAFSIWIRRPMWQQSHAKFLDGIDHFDAVIEPGELAAEFDLGPTIAQRDEVLLVNPVLHTAPNQRLSRAQARAELGLPVDATVIVLQLGSGNNFDMGPTRERFLDHLLRRDGVIVMEMQSPIRRGDMLDKSLSKHHVIQELQPSYRYSNAFDAAVSAAGYNAFHENLLGGVPTVFVPNEGADMDLQINRCLWAEVTGCGWLYRRNLDGPRIDEFIDHLLNPDHRRAVSLRCQSIKWTNGGQEIANYIEDHARLVRADRSAAMYY
jgi:UDP:flavonoid glycosyltransferase YjiC (YdhE family)/glycosyltransferase involved in cell wall biosynthesis